MGLECENGMNDLNIEYSNFNKTEFDWNKNQILFFTTHINLITQSFPITNDLILILIPKV